MMPTLPTYTYDPQPTYLPIGMKPTLPTYTYDAHPTYLGILSFWNEQFKRDVNSYYLGVSISSNSASGLNEWLIFLAIVLRSFSSGPNSGGMWIFMSQEETPFLGKMI